MLEGLIDCRVHGMGQRILPLRSLDRNFQHTGILGNHDFLAAIH
jgi:hypothetical protein